jgi:hypothetical protein
MEKLVRTPDMRQNRTPVTRAIDQEPRDQIEHLTAEGETQAVPSIEGAATNLSINREIRFGVIWA